MASLIKMLNRSVSFRIWTKTVLGVTLFLVCIVVAVNMTVDSNGILRPDMSRQLQGRNLNYVKMKYLLENPGRYSSFLFGSSRVATIDVKKKWGSDYYNMNLPEGLPKEYLEIITLLLQRGIVINHIMIGLDEFSYLVDPRQHLSSLDRQPHPSASGKKIDAFYGQYFLTLHRLLPRFKAYWEETSATGGSPAKKHLLFDVYDSGRIYWVTADEEIERDVKRHISSVIFEQPFHWEGDNIPETVAAIRSIVELAEKHNIQLTVFINPIHRTTYLDTDLRQFALFKKELALITDYYDFSGLNSITTNNYYYYETSHYRPLVGDMMLKVMFGQSDAVVPGDFGFFVTKNNIDDRLQQQCLEFGQVRTSAVFNKSNAPFADSCNGASRSLDSETIQAVNP